MNPLQKHITPKRIFHLGILLHLLAVLLPTAFVTHDGPSHLYNSHIINQLLFTDGSVYETYHTINPNWLQPNLSGYVLLSLFQLFLPFLWAEKMLVAIYVLLFAYGFRFFLKQRVPDADWYALLILPFIFNVVLFWGFYNFIIGLALSFFLIGLVEKYGNELSIRRIFVLCGLSLLVLYSHALVFVICVIYLVIRQLHAFSTNYSLKPASFWHVFKPALFLLPGSVLFLRFLSVQPATEPSGNTDFDLFQRLDSLWLKIDALTFSGYSEGAYAVPLYLLIILLAGIKIGQLIQRKQKLWSVSFLLVIVYFLSNLFTPDGAAGGNIIVLRLNLVFFLFLLVWIAEQDLTRLVKWMIGIYVIWSLPLLVLRYTLIQGAALQSQHIIESSAPFLRKNDVFSTVHHKPVTRFVGPYQIHVNFDMMSNIDHYAALAYQCLSLHNYESDRPVDHSYFPVIWRDTAIVDIVWDRILPGVSMEYIQLDTLTRHLRALPPCILTIGQSESQANGQGLWDPNQAYQRVFTDSISLLSVYKRVEDISE